MTSLVCGLHSSSSLFSLSSVFQNPLTKHSSLPLTSSSSASLLHYSPPQRQRFIISSARMSVSNTNTNSVQEPVTEQKRILVENKYGEKLVGLLDETGSAEVIILCLGFCSTKEYITLVNLANALTKEGISVFRFDFSGNGESEGSFEYGNYHKEADDLHSVVLYFSEAKRTVGGVLGHSKGGDVVLLYASMYHDVPIVVNASGRYDLKEGIEQRLGKDFMQRIKENGFLDVKDKDGNVSYRVTEESLKERLRTDMHAACLSIDKDCRVMTVHGSADEVIPLQDALEFSKVIPNHKLHIVEGANHGYSNHQAELAEVVVDFIKTSLQLNKDKLN